MIKDRGLGPGLLGPALFYGTLWGLGEAGLGHVLHLAHVPGLPGLVMVPLAIVVMGRAAAASRSRPAATVFLAGVVAASLKLFDLLAPGTNLIALINPIKAILFEALAGAAWFQLANPIFLGGMVPARGRSSESKP